MDTVEDWFGQVEKLHNLLGDYSDVLSSQQVTYLRKIGEVVNPTRETVHLACKTLQNELTQVGLGISVGAPIGTIVLSLVAIIGVGLTAYTALNPAVLFVTNMGCDPFTLNLSNVPYVSISDTVVNTGETETVTYPSVPVEVANDESQIYIKVFGQQIAGIDKPEDVSMVQHVGDHVNVVCFDMKTILG